jgi:hypothetical protein
LASLRQHPRGTFLWLQMEENRNRHGCFSGLNVLRGLSNTVSPSKFLQTLTRAGVEYAHFRALPAICSNRAITLFDRHVRKRKYSRFANPIIFNSFMSRYTLEAPFLKRLVTRCVASSGLSCARAMPMLALRTKQNRCYRPCFHDLSSSHRTAIK